MTIVGLLALALGLLGYKFAFLHPTRFRVAVFALAYVMHIGSCFFYYSLVSDGSSDAGFYYYDPADIFGEGFGLNTAFIIYIVQGLKTTIGGTYLDLFLVFQAAGFFGILLLMRIFEEIYVELGVDQPISVYLVLFLPSIHYWTSAIGKDSLFFLATSMALWAAMQFKRRMMALIVAMLIMVAIRPHIAAISLVAFTLAVMIDRNTPPVLRLLLFAGGLVGLAFSISTVWTTFSVDLTDVDVYSDALAGQGLEALAQSESAGNTAVNAIYPIRLLSLLFRPFFFDASGLLGLIVSFENALLLLMAGWSMAHFGAARELVRKVPFARYAIVSSVGILLVLAIGYYNVGLGIRQKATMILPGMLVFFVTMRAFLATRKLHAPAIVFHKTHEVIA